MMIIQWIKRKRRDKYKIWRLMKEYKKDWTN